MGRNRKSAKSKSTNSKSHKCARGCLVPLIGWSKHHPIQIPERGEDSMEEWWEKDPDRFFEEVRRVEEGTNARMRVVDGSQLPDGFGPGPHLAWEETVTSNSNRKYKILIICRGNHPYSAPAVWILKPDIRRCHHMFADGRLSLRETALTPDKTYVLNIRGWTCEWIDYYERGDCRTQLAGR